MNRLGLRVLAGALAALAAVALLREAAMLERLELAAWDAALRLRPAAPPEGRLVFVDETEEDLQRFGHPLPDATLARAIERALALGARVVGVDKYRDIPVPPGSAELDRVLAERAEVFWIYHFGGHGLRRIAPPARLAGSGREGFNDVVHDPDGIVRRALLFLDEGGPPRPSFALVLALAWLAERGVSLAPDPAGPARMRLGAAALAPLEASDGGYVRADAAGYQMLLDYRAMPAGFARVTLGELLDGRADTALFRGRIAILGASAESLRDFFQTPFALERQVTGAELHAHAAGQLLRLALGESGPARTLPDWAEYALVALACAAGLAAWLAAGVPALGATVAAGLAALAALWYLLALQGTWLPVVPLAIGFVLSAAVAGSLRALHEARARAALMSLFARHVSAEVAAELWARREELLDGTTLRPQALQATVLFADLRGFTPVAERLAPEATARWLNGFMAAMADAIMRHGGIVRQYAGDAVMAVFGVPVPSHTREEQARDARRAVACAVEMCRRLEALNAAWRAAGEPTAGMRIGVHSGPMVTCSVGSPQRMEYAVVGDAVNLAARLQALKLPGDTPGNPEGTRVLISEDTQALLGLHAECERLGTFDVKGRRQPVTVFRVPPQAGSARR
jgi:adenylate cyclase